MNYVSARRMVVAIALGMLASIATPASAQTYLDRLESLIKQNDKASATESANPPETAELPAPGSARADGTPGLNSVLESETSATATETAGQVFLGLQVENPVGGGLGVRVTSVTPQSPAWKAKINVDDRILAINGFGIKDVDGMAERMSLTRPGESCRFLISRNSRTTELTAVLMSADSAARLPNDSNSSSVGKRAWLGIDVRDLSPAFRSQFGLPVFKGAAVTSTSKGSPAQKAGIAAGDCIVGMDGQPIESAFALNVLMKDKQAGESVEFQMYRGGTARTVRLTLEVNPDDRSVVSTGAPTQTSQGNSGNGGTEPAGTPETVLPNETANSNARRILELEQQIAELNRELQESIQRELQTQAKLDKILETLKAVSN
ncbi:MAG: PDZ domain-containing protein [Planctomycetales bacterium]|nr:PDZ domain-containing protein [Planctomycetales bacterium]